MAPSESPVLVTRVPPLMQEHVLRTKAAALALGYRHTSSLVLLTTQTAKKKNYLFYFEVHLALEFCSNGKNLMIENKVNESF